MLGRRDVREVRKRINAIRKGEVDFPKRLQEGISVLVYAIDHLRDQPDLTDWLYSHEIYPGFLNRIRSKLVLFLGDQGLIRKPTLSDYRDILNHHYWNDVDPSWCRSHGKRGLYSVSPAEDVLIKLVSSYGLEPEDKNGL